MSNVKPIPDGYHSITPYLHVHGAARALDFYKQAFGARELVRLAGADGKVGHAEIMIGDSIVMLADEVPTMGIHSPDALKGTSVSIVLYVEDADKVVEQALAAGATVRRPLENKFYGDRSATLAHPFGHEWTISTHVEDIAPDEFKRRMAAETAKMSTPKKS